MTNYDSKDMSSKLSLMIPPRKSCSPKLEVFENNPVKIVCSWILMKFIHYGGEMPPEIQLCKYLNYQRVYAGLKYGKFQ